MTMAQAIKTRLEARLQPVRLEIVDESSQHAGHAGSAPGGETHFRVLVVSREFEGLSRVARQRLVYETLEGELKSQIHALSLKAQTPEEASA